ncbi:redox-sensitive transcriptional activator SoxR [Actinoallomurus purpureus]|uniref:redox-sensitive transcriptional activator SoxR n=1 Tax=Actinoallomurus purpureus TaxID=478114 RepID=UPI00209347D0|nr:redox-sensitive transcriptional activator SoxR [Actinoallomurus purpureus]MCO6003376.1 redox-sensitive transcriptional activator SoxR [Actinoallomurus purpureus]
MPEQERPRIAKELTIGELSERSGVSASALRFYERQGLIHSRRTSGNQRRYHRTTLRRVAFIRATQSVGMPLECVGHVLNMLPPDTELTREFWVGASEHWRQQVNDRIAKMERMRDRFTECIGCGCLSFEQCTLVNPGDVLGQQGPGPRRLLAP